jgi:hypothetical protein
MKTKLFLMVMGLVLVLFCYSFAQVPQIINYQGKLTTSSGAPVNDTLQMVFTIYADLGGATSLWTETQGAVVEKGVFNVLLGSVSSIPYSVFDGSIRYLGVKVGGDPEIFPRKPIVSVAYAYKSLEADTADYARNGAGDNDWDIIGDVLFTHGAWGIARYGNMLWGSADSTHVNLGVACTTGTSGQNYKYCTVGGGDYNTASFSEATVSGGRYNRGSGQYSTVSGGAFNFAGGGGANVGGGTHNSATALLTTVGGGHMNNASDAHATVAGGQENDASDISATVSGGYSNTASGWGATVGGGRSNLASDTAATVGGGVLNSASNWGATVGGGGGNSALDTGSTVAGGTQNKASGYFSTVSGGHQNTASGRLAAVASGDSNVASGFYATIGGGWYNLAAGDFSAIPFGDSNTITASGDYSYLFGIRSTLTQDSTFMVDMPHVWFGAESTGYEFPASRGTNDQVMVTDGSGHLSWGTVSSGGIGGSGTTNYLPKFTASTTLGNSVMYETGSQIGIGTTNPNSLLELQGSGAELTLNTTSSYAGMEIRQNGTSKWTVGWDAGSQYFYFYSTKTSPGTKMVIHDSTGNVGIGTTSPQGALDVSSTTGALIVPRMTTAQRNALTAVNGMIIYNTTTNQFNFYEAGAWVTK